MMFLGKNYTCQVQSDIFDFGLETRTVRAKSLLQAREKYERMISDFLANLATRDPNYEILVMNDKELEIYPNQKGALM